ncbi:unnamed protein product [Orchesella dallaii]|uniref:peptidylprolyl isomerase n=1 Tax=Orchesella dallaii TaxID=48710 RepID=A0ABP1PMP1_9HEXA
MSENELYRPESDPYDIREVRLIPGAADGEDVDPEREPELPSPVKKEVIERGTVVGPMPYEDGTRIIFHFETKDTKDGTVFDDTRNHPKPMELILGKKFKIDIWEIVLQTMRKGELSRYEIPKELCLCYPMVSKVIREANHPGDGHRGGSCCGHLANGTGHPDLDKLVQKPRDLTFTFEILDVNLPGTYEKEAWYMTDEEKVKSIPELKAEGNRLFKNGKRYDAVLKYSEAAMRLDTLMNKEQPGSPEFKELSLQKVPILTNLALALLKCQIYYQAIKHCTSALEIDPENVKATFRRGQARKGLGYWEEARMDFKTVLALDPKLHKAVKDQLAEITIDEKQTNEKMKVGMKKMF